MWSGIGPLKNQRGHLYVESQEVCVVLNQYFSSIFTTEKDMKTRKLSKVNGDVSKCLNGAGVSKALKVDTFLKPEAGVRGDWWIEEG